MLAEKKNEPKEWLELSEAAELLDVHFATLRRWADAGKVPHIRTVSGRRKFHRTMLLELMEYGHRPIQPLEANSVELEAINHTRLRTEALARQPGSWMELLNQEQRLAFRYSGQRLMALLLQIAAHEDTSPYMAEGQRIAESHGELCFRAGLSAHEVIQAFLFFRRNILDSIHETLAISTSHDQEEIRILSRTNDFFDMFLVNAIDCYLIFDHQRTQSTSSK